jgi:dihydrofolate reductase
MQTLTVDMFVSVDGWAGGATSPGYFGYSAPNWRSGSRPSWPVPQLVVLGRRTYEALAGLPEQARDASWHRMTELRKVVFSAPLKTVSWPNTRICRDDLITEVRRLKGDSDVPLRTMGSLSVARQLLSAALVDRLRLMTFPLLVGASGREPAFADATSADLALVDHRALDGRLLLVEYRPSGRDIPRG